MIVLQTVSHTRAEAYPPPRVNTTNQQHPFGHRRGKKTSTHPIRFAQLVDPVLPLLGPGLVFWMLIWEIVIWDRLARASTPTSRATARYPADMDMPSFELYLWSANEKALR